MTVMVEVGDGAAFGDEILGDRLLVERDGRRDGRGGEEEGGEESHGGISNTPTDGNGCEEFLAPGPIRGLMITPADRT